MTSPAQPVAAPPPADDTAPDDKPKMRIFAGTWSGPIGYVNRPSSDGRFLALEDGQELMTRTAPMPLLFQPELAPGHDGAKQGLGNITRMWVDGDRIMGEGTFDMNDPEAVAIARKVNDGYLGWTSVDLEPCYEVAEGLYSTLAGALLTGDALDIATINLLNQQQAEDYDEAAEAEDTLPPVGQDPGAQAEAEEEAQEDDVRPVDVYSGYTIMGASLVPYQAFPDARISLVAMPSAEGDGEMSTDTEAAEGEHPEFADVVMAELAPLDAETEGVTPELVPLVAASVIMRGASFALPVADGDPTWDAGGAKQRIAKWASSDGSGDKEKINWSKFGKAFLYRDPEGGDNVGAFMFPIADVVDGQLRVIPKAVFAAAQRLDAARISDSAKDSIKSKIRGLYSAIGKKQNRKLTAPFDATAPGTAVGNGAVDVHGSGRRVPSAGRGVGEGAYAQTPVSGLSDNDDRGRPQPVNPITRLPRIVVNGRQLTAAGAPLAPPAAWFEHDPNRKPTPSPQVDDNGRVYAYIATWKTADGYTNCHTGSPAGQCTTVPRSNMGYAVFHSGSVVTAEGTELAVGRIVVDLPHADTRPSVDAQRAWAHYSDTRNCAAIGRVGEDQYGIWFAGALVPEATDEQIAKLRRSPLSGDWRTYGASLELIVACAVNSQGFVNLAASGAPQVAPVPMARAARDQNGRVVALVAAGVVDPTVWSNRPAPVVAPGNFSIDIDAFAGAVVDRMKAKAKRDTEAQVRQEAAHARVMAVVAAGRAERMAAAQRRVDRLSAQRRQQRAAELAARMGIKQRSA